MTQIAMDVCWERHDEQGRESMILYNSRKTDGRSNILYRHADRETHRQTDRQTDTEIDRQTD